MKPWDPQALAGLRGAVARRDPPAIRDALSGRDLDAVLQLAGDGLLANPSGPLVQECAERLRRRGWVGDAELADALEHAESDLRPLAVDLEELASILEGDAWQDMAEFIDTLSDPVLAQRLERAIHGRGAFRRFHHALSDFPDQLTRFRLFTGERQRGRARRWLADHDLRPIGRRYDG